MQAKKIKYELLCVVCLSAVVGKGAPVTSARCSEELIHLLCTQVPGLDRLMQPGQPYLHFFLVRISALTMRYVSLCGYLASFARRTLAKGCKCAQAQYTK